MRRIIIIYCSAWVLLSSCSPSSPSNSASPSSSSSPTTTKKKEPKPPRSSLPGLTNLTNTCFANSSLNLLFTSSLLKELLKKPLEKEYDAAKKTYESDNQFTARQNLQKTLNNLYQARKQQKIKLCDELNAFFDAFEKARQEVKGSPLIGAVDKIRSNQADASEFLNEILELLQGQRLSLFNYNEFADKSVKTYATARYNMLELSLQNGISSVTKLLEARSHPEPMEGANQVENPLGVKMDSLRTEAIESPAPQSLIIVLKRYEQDYANNTIIRIASEVIPEKEISLTSHDKSDVKKSTVDRYGLHAIIVHSGTDPRGGHYIAYVFDPNHNQWVKFNDSQVSKVSETEMRDSTKNDGYIFLYEKKK